MLCESTRTYSISVNVWTWKLTEAQLSSKLAQMLLDHMVENVQHLGRTVWFLPSWIWASWSWLWQHSCDVKKWFFSITMSPLTRPTRLKTELRGLDMLIPSSWSMWSAAGSSRISVSLALQITWPHTVFFAGPLIGQRCFAWGHVQSHPMAKS